MANFPAQAPHKDPIVRIVHVFSPVVVQTDQSNFCSLVQELTGMQSAKKHRLVQDLTKEDDASTSLKQPKKKAKILHSSTAAAASSTSMVTTSSSTDSLSDEVCQPSMQEVGAATNMWVPLNILSDVHASHAHDFGASTISTELTDVSIVHEEPKTPGYLRALPSSKLTMPSRMRDLLQDEALTTTSGVQNGRPFWSSLINQSFDPFPELDFLYFSEDIPQSPTAQCLEIVEPQISTSDKMIGSSAAM